MLGSLEPGAGMIRPDYGGGGIVNLMSSIGAALGDPGTGYAPLGVLPPEALAGARRVVLLVVDGLGHDHLLGREGPLRRHLRGRLTSVFPSTTASAIPTFMTGLAPRQHGLTGWHMYFRELGGVAAVLPFRTRLGHQPLKAAGVTPEALLGLTPLFDRLPVPCHVVGPQRIVHSEFNVALSGRARRHGYDTLEAMFETIAGLVRGSEARSYVYAYWPELDSLAHEHGVASPQVAAAFAELDAAFGRFLEAVRGTGSVVIATADHGLIDTAPDDVIDLEAHPALRETLLLPLCGEPRAAYAYVRAGREARFEAYVRDRLAGRAVAVPGAQFVQQGWFGPGASHAGLADRIGDYVLIPQGRAVFRDWLAGEERYRHIGVHGGPSAAEMYVPLVVCRAA